MGRVENSNGCGHGYKREAQKIVRFFIVKEKKAKKALDSRIPVEEIGRKWVWLKPCGSSSGKIKKRIKSHSPLLFSLQRDVYEMTNVGITSPRMSLDRCEIRRL
ncbi:hypothetical protein chiPu_0010356 [Chiloscyllium punctatum]|uniref:Uncharacterized protein n=1 Tax=Chiloscyllium punctatum TaxID=137246 RepID=A0A401SNG4_CHIPU|nr:hypothetical protein [Chiloscyllium punctatum]